MTYLPSSRTKDIIYITILMILSGIGVHRIWYSGCIWETHDLPFNLARFAATAHCFDEGQFCPVWSRELNSGYGYPLLLFYPPLTSQIVAFLHWLFGIPILTSTKLLIGVGILISNLFTYLLGKRLWDRPGGFMAAILYMYLPYHQITVLIRGAIAEFLAQGMIPGVFLMFLSIDGKEKRFIITSTVISAILMLTHNATWLIVMPCIAGMMSISAIKTRNPSIMFHTIGAIVLSMGITAYYWLPALMEKQYVAIDNLIQQTHLSYRHHFVSFAHLFHPSWGYAGLGHTLTILFIASLILPLFSPFQIKYGRWILHTFHVISITLIGFTTGYSRLIWDHIPILQFIQFPWRLTGCAGFSAAVCAPIVLTPFKKKMTVWIILALSTVTAIWGARYHYFRSISLYSESSALSPSNLIESGTTAVVGDEYRPKDSVVNPRDRWGIRKESITGLSDSAIIIGETDTQTSVSFHVISNSASTIRFNCLYFPGWHAMLDEQTALPIEKEPETGLMMIRVPAGDHFIQFDFKLTAIQKTGIIIAFISVLIFLFLAVRGSFYEKSIIVVSGNDDLWMRTSPGSDHSR